MVVLPGRRPGGRTRRRSGRRVVLAMMAAVRLRRRGDREGGRETCDGYEREHQFQLHLQLPLCLRGVLCNGRAAELALGNA